jgi:DNA-directed RNA polymerase subunit F
MIKNSTPLSIAEAQEYISGNEESNDKIKEFINNFKKIDLSQAKELRKKLEELDLIKLKSTNISKLIDLLPENKEELNKIFIDVNLEEDETNKILDTIKEFI